MEASFWSCHHTWLQSAKNTAWCLLGCSIGDFSTIAYFQYFSPQTPVLIVFSLAILNGILTSIVLETFILIRGGLTLSNAFHTAIGMSLISMVSMEVAMNAVDYFATGGAKLMLQWMPLMLLAGFITPWPYNYWRLKKYGQGCCN